MKMYCTRCGTQLEENAKFCPECGMSVNSEQMYDDEWFIPEQKTEISIKNYDSRLDYNPIGMWGYFFYTILLNIPVIGWIFIILFAAGITKNINLRNYARAWLCGYMVALVFAILVWWPYIRTAFQIWIRQLT